MTASLPTLLLALVLIGWSVGSVGWSLTFGRVPGTGYRDALLEVLGLADLEDLDRHRRAAAALDRATARAGRHEPRS